MLNMMLLSRMAHGLYVICLLVKRQLLKHKLDGIIDRYKARLVEKGYAQQKCIAFDETFSPTCRMM